MCTFVTVIEKNTSPLSKNGEYYILKHYNLKEMPNVGCAVLLLTTN
ncbi:hypothetical protein IX332_001004 [Porphyromonas levii]|nr:hypothetical protein [Porphyromonas levii]MBR8759203.1 hypothetical protein [Porphyromonas levii]